jgi:hypothetical protein
MTGPERVGDEMPNTARTTHFKTETNAMIAQIASAITATGRKMMKTNIGTIAIGGLPYTLARTVSD